MDSGLECCEALQAVTWIPVSVSVDTPRHVTGAAGHSKSAAQGRTRDGRQNYVHFVTAYDIHFIVNNKYYAMNTGKVRNLPIFSKKFSAFSSHYLDYRTYYLPDYLPDYLFIYL